MATDLRTSTIVAATAGALATSLLAYAVYFDHRRRTDVEFRRSLRRENKRNQKAAQEEETAKRDGDVARIKALLERANKDAYPTSPELMEEFFMTEIAAGEKSSQDGSDPVDSALHFYKALKVYPTPADLIQIYDKTVPKPVIDVLALMIGQDSSINPGSPSSRAGSGRDVDD